MEEVKRYWMAVSMLDMPEEREMELPEPKGMRATWSGCAVPV